MADRVEARKLGIGHELLIELIGPRNGDVLSVLGGNGAIKVRFRPVFD